MQHKPGAPRRPWVVPRLVRFGAGEARNNDFADPDGTDRS